MDLGLQGTVALVTGSTSGLGLASAKALSAEGASVVICGRRGALAEQEAAALPGPARGLQADLTDAGTPARLVAATREAFGPPDVLVFSTGGPPPGTAADTPPEAYEEALRLLATPAVRLAQAVLPSMRSKGSGRIVFITSGAMREPVPNLVLSNSIRLAVHGFAKTLAREVASDGVTVNCVLPGRIATDRIEQLDRATAEAYGKTLEEVREAANKALPMGRSGQPPELGATVAFLCSRRAGYLTGASVPVDGGALHGH